MGRETVLFKTEEKMSRNEVADLLRALAGKIENDKVILQQDAKEVRLKIPGRVELEVKAEKRSADGEPRKNWSWRSNGWSALPLTNKNH